MKTFEYRGYDENGRLQKGLTEAVDLKDARERLAGAGVFAERLRAAGEQGVGRLAARRARLAPQVRSLVYRELGTLLAAGLPLVQALDILVQSPELGTARPPLAGVRDRIREGASLAEALQQAARNLHPFERAVIEAGERSGATDTLLDQLAGYLEQQQQLRERLGTAMIYPSIVVLFAILVAVILLGFVMPPLGKVLAQTGHRVPVLTRAMLLAGRIAIIAVPAALVLICTGLFWIRRKRRTDAAFAARFDSALFRVPLLGKAYALLVNIRFSRTLAILLRGGVSVVEGIGLAGRATGSVWVAQRCEQQADAVRHGNSPAEALRRVPPLSSSLPGWIQAGEASGNLAGFLQNAAQRYERQWARFLARFLALIEPILILLVGAFVLLITLAILLPVLQLNETL